MTLTSREASPAQEHSDTLQLQLLSSFSMGVRASSQANSKSQHFVLVVVGILSLFLLSMLVSRYPRLVESSVVRRCSRNPAEDTSFLHPNYVESYSLWMMPDAHSSLNKKLQVEIDENAATYSSPRFPPHVTLLPDIKLPAKQVISVTKEMVKELKKEAYPWHAQWQKVKKGLHYFQCAFILIQMDPIVMQAANVARRAFNMERIGPYMPHMSLVYADLSEEEKDEAVERSRARLFQSVSTKLGEPGFRAEKVSVWYTPTEDKSLASWCKIADIEI